MILSFAQLPPPFVGDEFVRVEGSLSPLIPPNSDAHTRRASWADPGTQARESLPPLGSSSCWQERWPITTDFSEIGPVTEPSCPPDCTLHSQVAHDASVVLRKMNALPARYVEQWQPDGTDDILYWLKRQKSAASPPSPPQQIDTAVTSTVEPTREDAVLLRLCKSPCF